MKIYDAALETELQNPDLTRGKLESARRVTVHHNAVPASVRYEVMGDTITADFPDGLRQEITTPAQDAWDEYENVQKYVPYTEAELADMAAQRKAADAAAQAAAEQAERIARIDAIDAQVTYTAMMTDTLMAQES